MFIKRNILFYPYKLKSGAHSLRVRVRWNQSNIAELAVGCYIDLNGWSRDAQRCKPRSFHGKGRVPAYEINATLDRITEIVNDMFAQYESQCIMPTNEQVRQQLRAHAEGRAVPQQAPTVFPAYNDFIHHSMTTGRWRTSTLIKARTIRTHLHDMCPTLTFEQLAENGMSTLIAYLLDCGLSNATIKRDIAFVKTFVRWAVEHHYIKESDFLNARPHLATTRKKVIYLDWDELMRIYNWDFSDNESLARVRDVFCFCCFTSLRWSDVDNLLRSDISDGCITITTVKTNDTLNIELNKYARAILDRYKDCDFDNGRALPVLCNQKMNARLKMIGKICGLNTPIKITSMRGAERVEKTLPKWQLLTTHVGRRTFVCNALMMGISANVVMKWTGHSDYSSMKPYIDIADETKQKAMALFDQR
jgi:integrase